MNGCDVLRELWKVQLECEIQKPGITGMPSRFMGFVQCSRVNRHMGAAALKCWEERNNTAFPPFPPPERETADRQSSDYSSKKKGNGEK
jgi:hypothetical protein